MFNTFDGEFWAGLSTTISATLTAILNTISAWETDAGPVTADTLRTAEATDTLLTLNSTAIKNAVEIMDDWDLNDRAKTSPIPGQDGVAATAGNADALTQRIIPANDSPGLGEHDEPATTYAHQIGAEAFEIDGTSPTAIAEGDTGRALESLYRVLYTTLTDSSALVEPIVAALNALRTSRTNPEWAHNTTDELVQTTNILSADSPHYYPSESGLEMDGYTLFSINGYLDDADGDMTLTLEVCNDDTPSTSTIWKQVQIIDDNTAATVANFSVSNTSLVFAGSLIDFSYRWVRIKVTNTGDTNEIIVFAKRCR